MSNFVSRKNAKLYAKKRKRRSRGLFSGFKLFSFGRRRRKLFGIF